LIYDDAIISLSKAIAFDPLNKDAYFERAIAYFEAGQFDHSLKDYLFKGKDITFTEIIPKEYQWALKLFGEGLLQGGIRGIHAASSEFIPSTCNSVGGIGNFLWMAIQHSIETPREFADSIMQFCNYLRTCDKAEFTQLLVPETYELIVN
jgi:tetratricopeptide (TPR) repeat protein